MRSKELRITVSLLTVDEFAEGWPQYGPRARGEGRALFDLVMRPQTFRDADVLSRLLGLPAVTAVAAIAIEVAGGELTSTDRQFLGALMCALMEANGYVKTGRKRAVPHPLWKRGEVYVIVVV